MKFLLEIHPEKKIGLIIDMCSSHNTEGLKDFVEENWDSLVVGYFDGGLTSFIQVCELVANKDLKRLIVDGYYVLLIEFICEHNLTHPEGSIIKLKIELPVIIGIVEGAVKAFNLKQCGNR